MWRGNVRFRIKRRDNEWHQCGTVRIAMRCRETSTTAESQRMIRKALIAALLISASTGFALAQSAPSPNNQSGPGVSPTTPSPTDPSVGGESGNTVGIPSRSTITPAPNRTTGEDVLIQRGVTVDRDNTSVPGQGVDKDDYTAPRR